MSDWLIGAIDYALDDPKEYPDKIDAGYISLLNLHNRLKELYEKTYD